HHGPVDLNIRQPFFGDVRGPLRSANIAFPLVIFWRGRDWLPQLDAKFDVAHISIRPFSALSYIVTGGISRKLPVPRFLYRGLFPIDLAFSRCLPRLCASFFTITLTRR